MPDLKPVTLTTPKHCAACLDTGRIWDFAHTRKIPCVCQPVAVTLPRAA